MLSLGKVLLSIFFVLASQSYAKEQIEMVWAFNPGSNQANTLRNIIHLANQQQNKYQFVFSHRPGAGGTIAAGFVDSNPNNAIVAMSSSFIIRPYFEQGKNSHNLDDFVPIMVQGTGSPLFIVSNRILDIHHLLQQKHLTVGVSGIGSVSHLAAIDLSKKMPNVTIVNFKNMVEAMVSAAGGHIDVAIGFYVDAQPIIEAEKLKIIGYTGEKTLGGFSAPRLKNHGIESFTVNYAMFTSKKMDEDRRKEIRNILLEINAASSVIEGYQKDLLEPASHDWNSTLEWYQQQRTFWRRKVTQAIQEQQTKQQTQ